MKRHGLSWRYRFIAERSSVMAKTEHRQRSLALYETILKLKDLDECCKFFDDLCTPLYGAAL